MNNNPHYQESSRVCLHRCRRISNINKSTEEVFNIT